MKIRPLVHISTDNVLGITVQDYIEQSFHSLNFGGQVSFQSQPPRLNLALTELGPVKMSQSICTAHRFQRTLSHVSTDKCDYFGLYYIRSGNAIFSNRHREVSLSAGNYVLIDNRGEHNRQVLGDCIMTGMHFPRLWLESKLPNPEEFIFKSAPLSGWGMALSAALDATRTESLKQQNLPPEAVAEQIAYLMALSFGQSNNGLRRSQKNTLERLRRIMRERMMDPTLTPAALALEEGLGLRTLYALFAAAGTSFGRDLMSMRLDRARDLLGDPRYAYYSISEISQLTGFNCPSHFGQRFRRAFGVTPRSYRLLRDE